MEFRQSPVRLPAHRQIQDNAMLIHGLLLAKRRTSASDGRCVPQTHEGHWRSHVLWIAILQNTSRKNGVITVGRNHVAVYMHAVFAVNQPGVLAVTVRHVEIAPP